MSTYYKKIEGKNYDRAMLEKAENSIKGKGDGRISLTDARNLIKLIRDGGRITDIEKRTLAYILENYNFTDTAIKYIEKTLSEALIPDSGNVAETHIEEKENKKSAISSISKKTVIIISLILLLIVIIIFAVLKIFNKNNKTVIPAAEKKDEIVDTQKTGIEIPKPEAASLKTDEAKPVQKEIKITDNEYIVKENDNLIKISKELYNDYRKWQDIYNLNKDKLDKPSVIFPGQVLKLPEKQNK